MWAGKSWAIFVLLHSCHCVIALSLTDQWEIFKAEHGKVYHGREDDKRHNIWKQNVEYINEHNRQADKGEYLYRLGVNHFADWSQKERDAVLRRPVKSNSAQFCTGKPIYDHGTIPKNFDWRSQGVITPVQNEGMCGSPWAFSVTGALEAREAIYCPPHKLVALSAQQLIDCSSKYGNYGCDGGFMDTSYEYILKNGGIDTNASYPYEGKDGKCRFNPETVGAMIRGCIDLPKGNETALQIIIFVSGPVSIGINAAPSSFDFYKSGVYDDPDCKPDQLDHAALVVGFGVLDDKKYWIVKNSWGKDWGLDGYILIARDQGNMCGVASLASYPEMLCEF